MIRKSQFTEISCKKLKFGILSKLSKFMIMDEQVGKKIIIFLKCNSSSNSIPNGML